MSSSTYPIGYASVLQTEIVAIHLYYKCLITKADFRVLIEI